MRGAARDIELEAQIDSPADQGTLQALVLDAVAASPLNGLMRGRKESLFSSRITVARLRSARLCPCRAQLDRSRRLVRACDPRSARLVEPDRPPGSDPENRRNRHARWRQPQGRAKSHSPCARHLHAASEWHEINRATSVQSARIDLRFLSEEGPPNGGQVRAPDAVTYISAGIAFCFLTQLGRYAKIVRKTVDRYACVQDTHFTLGGASAGTGKPGEADPVETHLYVVSPETDDFARAALDMSEQTCYLHAFCKTDLKAKVRVIEQVRAA